LLKEERVTYIHKLQYVKRL